jgi:NAD(P)-dependent dehydrogenase (short-subunit alcohol dehydrogenase family)
MKKRAIVTGGASGMGLAVAKRLIATGISVMAVDINVVALKTAGLHGADIMAVDLCDAEARARVARKAGTVDYLVNAAGIIHLEPIHQVTLDSWRQIFAVNTEALFFLTQLVVPRMRDSGAVVNVSSMVARLPRPDFVAYAASKEAVLSVTRAWAAALAPRRIRVNAVCPGIIDTPMQDRLSNHVAREQGISRKVLNAQRVTKIPLTRLGTPDDCAAVICFLLSDEASYLTGQALGIDGGMTMC